MLPLSAPPDMKVHPVDDASGKVDLADVAPRADFATEISMLAKMEREGLVVIGDGKLTVTDTGRSVVRVVASTFDAYRRCQGTRFSTAV